MEPLSYKERYDALVEEIKRREWNHKSPLEQPDFSYLKSEYREYKIDVESLLRDLLERCPECKKRYENILQLLVNR